MARTADPPPRTQRYRLIKLSEVPKRLHPDNKRQGDVGELVELIRVNGFAGACLVDRETGFFAAGNHRSLAMVAAAEEIRRVESGEWVPAEDDDDERERWESWSTWRARYGDPSKLPIIERDFTPDELRRHLIADNVASDKATWDEHGLYDDLGVILDQQGSLTGTGYSMDDYEQMHQDLERDSDDAAKSDGSMLERTDVSVADPVNVAERGKVYRLGRHVLCVVDLMADWPVWVPFLTDADGKVAPLFVPYPGPYVPLAERALRAPLVMVQPEAFIAGHMLDKWVAVNGPDSYEVIE